MADPIRPIEAFIFDMDGVILDSERIIRDAWLEVVPRFGYPADDAVFLQLVGRNSRDAEQIIFHEFGAAFPLREVLAATRARSAREVEATGWPLKPGITVLLERLSDHGFPMAVATSTSRAEAESRLTSAGVRGFFRHVHGGDEVAHGKPSPDLFLLAARSLEVSPAGCVVIEDSQYGVEAALAARMQAVVIPDLKHPSLEVASKVLGVYESAAALSAALDEILKLA
ncbi:MAG: HAD family phosphatase [Gammaproteobacteria bacterium]|nr:HAD family phosphatase [Gammaproteobacteria bacterium]